MNDFEAFYRQNLRLVYATVLARRADREFAEDVAQETFYRAWRHFSRLSKVEPPAQRAWLVQTATRVIIDEWRREQRRREERGATVGNTPTDAAEESEVALRVDAARALAELDEMDRQIVLLRYFSQVNSNEIGKMLDMPESTVRYRLAQARRALATHLMVWRGEREQK
jgi:RNA polymerase sigma-70 factor (ECF subfamily)